jgi:RHS repeat-associated protein
VSTGFEVEGFVHDVLDRLTQIRRNGALSEILEYAPTGEPLFRKLGTQGTWYGGAVATVTGTVPASCYDTTTCVPVAGTVKVAAHVQVAGGRVASVKAAAGAGLDPVSDVLYYHRDMQGSVVATTYRAYGYSGSMGARYRYTPYGQLDRVENVSALSDSELGYTGGLRLGYAAGVAQQGNLVLLGARVYHAEMKRWLVPDTVDARRYTYAVGDPVNSVDPSGRMAIVTGGGLGGGTRTQGVNPGPASSAQPMAKWITVGDDCFEDDETGQVVCIAPLSDGSNPPPGNSRPPPPGSYPTNPGGGGGGGGGGRGTGDRSWISIGASYAMVGIMALRGKGNLGSSLAALGTASGQTAVGTLSAFGVGETTTIIGVMVQLAANFAGNAIAASLATAGPVGIVVGVALSGVAAGFGSALADWADGRPIDAQKAIFAAGLGMVSALAPAFMVGTGIVAIACEGVALASSAVASVATAGFGMRSRPRRVRRRRRRIEGGHNLRSCSGEA